MYRRSPHTLRSFLLVLLMLMAPLTAISPDEDTVLRDVGEVRESVGFSNGSGDQLVGEVLTLNNSNWVVEPNRGFDSWKSGEISNHSGITSTDLMIDELGRIHGCWTEGAEGVWMFKTEADGNITTQQVDDSAVVDGCTIAIDAQDNLYIAFISEDHHLHLSREARKGTLNHNRTFLTRALIAQHAQHPLEIGFDVDGIRSSILWRDANDSSLWMTNHTGTYWQTRQLVDSPVGDDFELVVVDETFHIAYTSGKDIRLLLVNDTTEKDSTLIRLDFDMDGNRLGFNYDSLGNLQVIYADEEGDISMLRSLKGTDNDRISSNPLFSLNLTDVDDESLPSIISAADLDADGNSELVIGNSAAGNGSGALMLIPGSSNRSVFEDGNRTSWLNGSDGDALGHSMTFGDFNGDGVDDLVVASPGATTHGNATGVVNLYLGSSLGMDLLSDWNWTLNATNGETGHLVANAGDVDDDGDDELLITTSNYTAEGMEKGRVDMFLGSPYGFGQVSNWSLNGSTLDATLGVAIAGQGDVDGDGYDDFAISATGSMDTPIGFGSVHVFHGSPTGVNQSADTNIEVNIQGKLFGFSLLWADINGDGHDELFVSEPLNGSTYGAGLIWIFNGASSGLETPDPVKRIQGGNANANIGSILASMGDINEDGIEDVLFNGKYTSKMGELNIIHGQPTSVQYSFLDSNPLVQGSEAAQLFASVFSSLGDIDGDDSTEIAILEFEDSTSSTNATLNLYSHQSWYSSELRESTGTLEELQIDVSLGGAINILADGSDSILLQSSSDGQGSSYWLEQELSPWDSISIASFSSGGVAMLGVNQTGLHLLTHSSHQLVSQSTLSSSHSGHHPDLVIDENGNPSVIHYKSTSSELYWTRAAASGWATSLVRSNVGLSSAPTHLVDDENSKMVVFTNTVDSSLLQMHRPLNSWQETTLVDAGDAVGTNHAAMLLSNGSLAVLSVVDTGSGDGLNLTILNGSTIFTESLEQTPNRDAQLVLREISGSIHIAWQNGTGGECVGMSREADDVNWTRDWSFDLNRSGTTRQLMTTGSGDNTVVHCTNDGQEADLLVNLVDGSHENSTDLENNWGVRRSLEVDGTTYIIFEDGVTGDMTLRSYDSTLGEAVDARLISNSVDGAAMDVTADGVLHVAYTNKANGGLSMLRLLPDADADRIPDILDDMMYVSGQWEDSDGDGFGDNPDGPAADDCTGTSGTSIIGEVGCIDYDGDMFSYNFDDCTTKKGYSYFDRMGCTDYDRDGWSNNDESWVDGDQFMLNWKQQRDSDGDTRGDNSGPDCCISYWPDTDTTSEHEPDIFPQNQHQWADVDGDGYGDNTTHESGDGCKLWWGNSSKDKNGCPDSDGDGYSNPHEYAGKEWTVEKGADAFVDDPTQWRDTDGDGFGDNSGIGDNNSDHFPFDAAAANDSDRDGYPDNWTAMKNSTNTGNLTLDSCPGVWGNSSINQFGCPDRDGDGWSDLMDDFPDEPSQWLDSDEDGWGDEPSPAWRPDYCPQQAGVENGTGGDGCPIVIAEDEDGDLVVDDDDNCPGTPQGESVDSDGCAESQKDDDGDEVMNDVDECPDTPVGAVEVNDRGCTSEQETQDSDNDTVADPDDDCPGTPVDETADDNGCSPSQLDDDRDGVSNALDECPDTPDGAAIDDFGCIEEGVDSDGDGVPDTDDPRPGDSSQWEDADGDGYGDNLTGNEPDSCISIAGNSTEDRFGCLDSDGDGYSDGDMLWTQFSGADAFPSDSTQWRDGDQDGYGDNSSGNKPDKCPQTASTYRDLVDDDGCSPDELDSDSDGVSDMNDQCENTPSSHSVDSLGCSLPGQEEKESDETSSGMDPVILYGGGGLGAMVLIVVVILIIRGGGGIDLDDDDDDDWYDDDEDDEDDEDDVFSSLDSGRRSQATSRMPSSGPPQASPSRGPTGGPPGGSGPVGGPPTGGPPVGRGPQGGPPMNRGFDPYAGGGYGGPPTGGGGYGFSAPAPVSRGPPPGESAPAVKKAGKKVVSKEEVEKAREEEARKQNWQPEDEGPLFDPADAVARQDSVAWVWDELQIGNNDRSILMTLQESGWSARQSRAILDEAKAW